MTVRRRLAFAVVAPLMADAQALEIFHDQDPSRWGAPARIVEPRYPEAALEKRITGYVDFEGLVTDEGTLRDIEYRAETPEAQVFVAALQEVVPRWVFYPAIGEDCMPQPRRYVTRVWFELADDQPKITTTRRRGEGAAPVQPAMKVEKRHSPRYPQRMQRFGEQALVYSRMEVAPDGKVTAVATRVYPRDEKLQREFGDEVEFALRKWIWSPAPAGYSRTRISCTEVSFRLRD